MDRYPNWLYDLLIAVLEYERDHGHRDDGWPCFEPTLILVPYRNATAHAPSTRTSTTARRRSDAV